MPARAFSASGPGEQAESNSRSDADRDVPDRRRAAPEHEFLRHGHGIAVVSKGPQNCRRKILRDNVVSSRGVVVAPNFRDSLQATPKRGTRRRRERVSRTEMSRLCVLRTSSSLQVLLRDASDVCIFESTSEAALQTIEASLGDKLITPR
jgi:hypothetical protein